MFLFWARSLRSHQQHWHSQRKRQCLRWQHWRSVLLLRFWERAGGAQTAESECWSSVTLLQLTDSARMRQANTADLSAMAMPWAKKHPEWLDKNLQKQLRKTIKMLKNDTKCQAQLKELISVAFQLRMSKVLKMKQLPSSSSPRTCGFKPLTGIFPTAERPDNRMKRLMTKPWRSKRTKEHRVIPANDPNVPNTNSWRKQMKGKTQNPETKRAHKINHLMGKNAYKAF